MIRKRRLNLPAIHRFMKEQDMSRKQLADGIGVNPCLISNWFQGTHHPLWHNIYSMAEVLKVSVEQIIYDVTKYRDIQQLEMVEAIYDHVSNLVTQLDHLIENEEDPKIKASLIYQSSEIISNHFEKIKLNVERPVRKDEEPSEPLASKTPLEQLTDL